MFKKTFFEELENNYSKLYPAACMCIAVTVFARAILSFSNSVAVDGRPPFIDAVASWLGFASLAILLVAVLVFAAVTIKRRLVGFPMTASEYFGALVAAFAVIALSALIYFCGNLLLLAGGSYYEYYFGDLVPPLCFDTSTYGVPFALISLPTFVISLWSILAMLSGAFALAAGKKHRSAAIMLFFLLFYALALVVFLVCILSDTPRASGFSYLLISGNYADIIAGSIAAAISLAVSGAAACLSAILAIKKYNGR